jgi:hypothetical protein
MPAAASQPVLQASSASNTVIIQHTPADPHWTAYVSALSVPVVAAFAACIAWRQWMTARNKLKFDLFERRFAFYELVLGEIGNWMSDDHHPGRQDAFHEAQQMARWTFSPEVAEYFRGRFVERRRQFYQAYRQGTDRLKEAAASLSADEHFAVYQPAWDIRADIRKEVDELLGPYLSLEH